jgi:hypothetical protein
MRFRAAADPLRAPRSVYRAGRRGVCEFRDGMHDAEPDRGAVEIAFDSELIAARQMSISGDRAA